MKNIAKGVALSVCLVGATQAQEQTLRVTQVFAATHWHWTEGMKTFTEAVTEKTGGNIDFEVYHAGQIGKESTTLVTSGLADIGLLVPSYESDKLPLTTVAELPGLHTNACEGTRKFWEVAQEGGALYEAEFKPLGVRPLYVILLPPYQLMTGRQEVTTLEDLSGLKIRANGAAMDKTVRDLGATPVRVTSNELYDSLSRGTVDGSFWIIGSTKLVGLENVLSYTVQGPMLGAGATFLAISDRAWDRLDEPTQQAMMEAGQETMDHLCNYLDNEDVRITQELVDEGKLTVTTLPPEELDRWNSAVANVGREWADEMDSTRRPGSALLEAYTAAGTGN